MNKIDIKKIVLWTFAAITAIIVVLLYSSLFYSEEKNLGGGFKYFGGHYADISYWSLGDTTTVFIPPHVLSYVNTKQYILVKQHPLQFDDAIYPKFYEYSYGRDSTYYWFVDKQEKSLIGPLLLPDMESFLREKDLSQMLQKLESKKEI